MGLFGLGKKVASKIEPKAVVTLSRERGSKEKAIAVVPETKIASVTVPANTGRFAQSLKESVVQAKLVLAAKTAADEDERRVQELEFKVHCALKRAKEEEVLAQELSDIREGLGEELIKAAKRGESSVDILTIPKEFIVSDNRRDNNTEAFAFPELNAPIIETFCQDLESYGLTVVASLEEKHGDLRTLTSTKIKAYLVDPVTAGSCLKEQTFSHYMKAKQGRLLTTNG